MTIVIALPTASSHVLRDSIIILELVHEGRAGHEADSVKYHVAKHGMDRYVAI